MNKFLHAIAVLCGLISFAQNPGTDRFSDAAAAYFKADREKIHLHPNKSVFTTGESIWFKGYITELKTGMPYGATTNVHLQLRDAQGKVLREILAFAEGSIFSGHIPIDKALPGGLYHIQAYTNFMNNFAEDESALVTISIINKEDGKFYDYAKTGPQMEVDFFPEGGALVDGIPNTVGVRIRDCNGNGIAVQDASVTDGTGKTVAKFSTTESGYGRFDLQLVSAQQYLAAIVRNGSMLTSKLPAVQPSGVSLSANSYANPQKAVIRLRTNERGAKSGPYTLYIQQAALASGSPIDLSSGEQTIAVPTADLPYGVSTLFVTDGTGKIAGRRVFFNPMPGAEPSLEFTARKKGDSTIVHGVSSLRNGEISISVLPVQTIADRRLPDMATSLWADPFISEPIGDISALASDYSRKNGYELDNRLICSMPKYDWASITGTPPAEKYPFDIGLTVRGSINSELKDRASAKVTMNSYELGLNETVSVNNRNEVIFENILAVDSSHIHFSLFEKNERMAKMQMAFSVHNASRQFVKSFTAKSCTPEQMWGELPIPKIDGAITLADVVVEQELKTKPKLSNTMRYQNNWARGYKIDEAEAKSYRDVLSFIQNHGYNVEHTSGNVIIRSRSPKSFQGTLAPLVFIDDVPISNFNELYGYSLDRIDEIYINKHGFGGGDNSQNGTIRIYTRRDLGARGMATKVKSQSFVLDKGFQPYQEFEMPRYDSFEDPGFQSVGSLHWLPRVGTDATGNFAFALPHTGLSQVKVVVRGISSEGIPISMTRIVNLK